MPVELEGQYIMSNGSKEMLPDFLGIGAQRTGTTWLWENLRQHPGIWMPSRKEIHYFERSTSYPFYKKRRKDLVKRRRLLMKRILGDIRESSWRELSWDLKFLLGLHDDEWYASLFEGAGDKVKGEITPAYSFLMPREIEHIKGIMPRAKIIFLIRNPIDRAWSVIRFDVLRKSGQPLDLGSFSLDDLGEAVGERHFVVKGDYIRTINNWKGHFPEEQFFIGFFDDIVQNPSGFLSDVFEFLGVESSEEYVTQLAFTQINASPYKEMPSEFRLFLANKYYSQTKTLSKMLGGHANQWLQDVEKLLLISSL